MTSLMQHIWQAPLQQVSGSLQPQAQRRQPILQHSLLLGLVTIPHPVHSSPGAHAISRMQHNNWLFLLHPQMQSSNSQPDQKQPMACSNRGAILILDGGGFIYSAIKKVMAIIEVCTFLSSTTQQYAYTTVFRRTRRHYSRLTRPQLLLALFSFKKKGEQRLIFFPIRFGL